MYLLIHADQYNAGNRNSQKDAAAVTWSLVLGVVPSPTLGGWVVCIAMFTFRSVENGRNDSQNVSDTLCFFP